MLNMHRHQRLLSVIGSLLAGLTLTQPIRTQPATLAGLVRRADGSALAGAEVVAFPLDLVAGLDIVGLEVARAALPQPDALRTITNARGEFRFGSDRPSRILIRHDCGLGALLPRLVPGTAQRVTAQPMAEIVLPPGAEAALVRVDALAAENDSLGRLAGPTLRLPAGVYRVLVLGNMPSEHRVNARSSERVQLFQRAARDGTWPIDADRVIFDGWCDSAILVPALGRVNLWPSPALNSSPTTSPSLPREVLLLRNGPGRSIAFGRTLATPTSTNLRAPRFTWRTLEAPVGITHVATFAAHGDPGDDTPRCVALSPIAGDGSTQVPVLANGILVTLGVCVAAFPIDATNLRLPAHRDLVLTCAAEGTPIDDAELQWFGPPPQVRRSGRTDTSGRVTLRGVPISAATVELHARAHWAIPKTMSAAEVSSGSIQLPAEIGAELNGRVTIAGRILDQPIEVTLRDPTAVLAMRPRQQSLAAGGTFSFPGLDPTGRYTLFATAQIGGVTYSAKLHGVLPGTEVTLELRSEDVPPPGR